MLPKATAEAPPNPMPTMATIEPPPIGPEGGRISVMFGVGMYVKRSADDAAEVPPGVVTVTSTVPEPAGAVAVIDSGELTVKVPAAPPKDTLVASLRLVPPMVTSVPPVLIPDEGVTEVTAGWGGAV